MFLLTPVAAQDNFKSLELAKGKAAAPAPSPAFQTQKPVYIDGEKQDLQLVLITLWLKMVWKKMSEFATKTTFSRVSDLIFHNSVPCEHSMQKPEMKMWDKVLKQVVEGCNPVGSEWSTQGSVLFITRDTTPTSELV